MAIRIIREDGDEILRKKAKEVEIVDDKIKEILNDMVLSFPNQFAKIIRPAEVTIEALNEEGKKIKLKGTGLLAQAISHELDHLDGILFVDKIIPGTLEYVNSEEKEKK